VVREQGSRKKESDNSFPQFFVNPAWCGIFFMPMLPKAMKKIVDLSSIKI
jgi:hypothetical protein